MILKSEPITVCVCWSSPNFLEVINDSAALCELNEPKLFSVESNIFWTKNIISGVLLSNGEMPLSTQYSHHNRIVVLYCLIVVFAIDFSIVSMACSGILLLWKASRITWQLPGKVFLRVDAFSGYRNKIEDYLSDETLKVRYLQVLWTMDTMAVIARGEQQEYLLHCK